MAKHNNDSTSGCLGCIVLVVIGVFIYGGFAAITDLFQAAIALAVLAFFAFIVYWLVSAWSRPDPSKTVTYGTTWFGERTKNIKYHDTGKEVDQVTSTSLLGQTTKTTYVSNPGTPQAAFQKCHRCGASVASMDGSFHCDCGKRWGRR